MYNVYKYITCIIYIYVYLSFLYLIIKHGFKKTYILFLYLLTWHFPSRWQYIYICLTTYISCTCLTVSQFSGRINKVWTYLLSFVVKFRFIRPLYPFQGSRKWVLWHGPLDAHGHNLNDTHGQTHNVMAYLTIGTNDKHIISWHQRNTRLK